MTKIAFFDLDGTLLAPRFYLEDNPVIGFPQEVWGRYCRYHENPYEDSVIVPQVFKYAEDLWDSGWELHILTATINNYEEQAKQTLFKSTKLNTIFQDIHCISIDDAKKMFIEEYLYTHQISPENCILVEDMLRTLYSCVGLGINIVHTSHIFAYYGGDTSMAPILHFETPKKIRTTKDHNEMYQADGAPPGVYVPNMSEEDMRKWRAKKIGGTSARIEIRTTVMHTGYNGAQMVCVVYKDLEGEGPAIKISTNNKLVFSLEDWENLKLAVTEALEMLRKAES